MKQRVNGGEEQKRMKGVDVKSDQSSMSTQTLEDENLEC